jgi:hypothetical protein
MPLASDFFKSNWINAASLEAGVCYEAIIVSVGPHTFETGETELTIRLDWKGKAIVLNKTRLEALIEAFGVNYDNWPGQKIAFWLGDTFWQGKPAKCVTIEGIVLDRLEAKPQQRPALGAQRQVIDGESRRGSTEIPSSSRGASPWNDSEPPPVDPDDPGPRMREPGEDDIPWG